MFTEHTKRLVKVLRDMRNNIDVSTIRNTKKATLGWEVLVSRAEEVLRDHSTIEAPLMSDEKARLFQKELERHVFPWSPTSAHPADYERLNGLGEQVAFIDRHCGGYQDAHSPFAIGWRVQIPGRSDLSTGYVKVGNTVQGAISKAMMKADDALERLLSD